MPYNQAEAKLRFEGLLGLFERAHEKAKSPIATREELVAISAETRHLCEAYDEEISNYLKNCGNEQMYHPTIAMILKIQFLAACTHKHLLVAEAILDNGIVVPKIDESLRWN